MSKATKKYVEERCIKPSRNVCAFQYTDKFREDDHQEILEQFWTIGDINHQLMIIVMVQINGI